MHSNPVTWLPHSQLERYEKANIHTVVCWEILSCSCDLKDIYVAAVNSQTPILRGLLLGDVSMLFLLSSDQEMACLRSEQM